MGRATHEPKHLLDVDAEQNIGNSVNLQPQDGGGPVGGTTTPQTNPEPDAQRAVEDGPDDLGGLHVRPPHRLRQ
jgi:hypothetical protein